MPGDVIAQLDGVAVSDLVKRWRPLYGDSNEAARLRDIGAYLTRGACGPADVVVVRGAGSAGIQSARVESKTLDLSRTNVHDLPGNAAFMKLADDIAYLKLSLARAADSAGYIQAADGTRGLIIDIRDYPSDFVVFTLGQFLVSAPTSFAWFTNVDPGNPGAIRWGSIVNLIPRPHYGGKVVILVDEITQSSAEYHGMGFRAAPGAIVIGSTTAGADGNVSAVPLPGGYRSYISGLGVFYPDKRPTQRVGIVPDIVVTPTIDGIRAGRDELIEEAVRQIRGEGAASELTRR